MAVLPKYNTLEEKGEAFDQTIIIEKSQVVKKKNPSNLSTEVLRMLSIKFTIQHRGLLLKKSFRISLALTK